MDSLDVYTKRNIMDYLSHPEESKDKNYSKERQQIRQELRKNLKIEKKQGQVADESWRNTKAAWFVGHDPRFTDQPVWENRKYENYGFNLL